MKKSVFVIAAVGLAASVLVSCENKTRLAKDIEGTWQANPVTVPYDAAGSLTMTDTWTFVRDNSNAAGGSLIISSMSSVETPLNALTDTIAAQADPYAVTLAASVSLNAKWDLDAHDPDDEIIISFDPRSLTVAVDPDAVAVSADGNPAIADSIQSAVIAAVRAEVTRAVKARFFPVDRLEDVEIKGQSLKFELPPTSERGHETKITLRRQDSTGK